MDIEEARSKKSKAIGVLVKYQADKAIDWLMRYSASPVGLRTGCDSAKNWSDQIDAESVEWCHIFEHSEKHYQMYFQKQRIWGDESKTSGEFVLIFEDEVVLKTSYSVNYDEDFNASCEISWGEYSIKKLLLSKWVEDIPEYVDREKVSTEERKKKDVMTAEKAEIKNIESDVSLGDYE